MDAFEPAGDVVDGGGLVDDAGVGPGVDEIGGCEEVRPEFAAVGQGVLVELAERLVAGNDQVSY